MYSRGTSAVLCGSFPCFGRALYFIAAALLVEGWGWDGTFAPFRRGGKVGWGKVMLPLLPRLQPVVAHLFRCSMRRGSDLFSDVCACDGYGFPFFFPWSSRDDVYYVSCTVFLLRVWSFCYTWSASGGAAAVRTSVNFDVLDVFVCSNHSSENALALLCAWPIQCQESLEVCRCFTLLDVRYCCSWAHSAHR